MAGTPGYQAPEQLMGEHVGSECDVYTYGCLLLELFGATRLWDGLTFHQIMCFVTVQNKTPDLKPICHLPKLSSSVFYLTYKE